MENYDSECFKKISYVRSILIYILFSISMIISIEENNNGEIINIKLDSDGTESDRTEGNMLEIISSDTT